MRDLFCKMKWLESPPENIRDLISKTETYEESIRISKYSLNSNQLIGLNEKVKKIKNNNTNLKKLKILYTSNGTADLLLPIINATGLRYHYLFETKATEFDQIASVALSSESILLKENFDIIVIAVDYRALNFIESPGNEEIYRQNSNYSFEYFFNLIEKIREKSKAKIIIQNFAHVPESINGSYEINIIGTLQYFIAEINNKINKYKSPDIFIFDVSHLASLIGLNEWHDAVKWNSAKFLFSIDYMEIYADYVLRVINGIFSKNKRCVIIDLDNTIWGGVIGDDGLDGIKLGYGDPVGEAFVEFQKFLLKLIDRGIILAVCSKNDILNAKKPFINHPDMILKLENIAIFKANWDDKAKNIREIASQLSLGLDTFVFLDDNPAERLQVRMELPEVSVPELPVEPAHYSRVVNAAGYFEITSFVSEDLTRSKFYLDNAKRLELSNQHSNLDSYLNSLEMVIYCAKFTETNRKRIVQLIQKSNQFNLTTKRYSETDIIDIQNNTGIITFQLRLKDKFGDNGMISVLICHINEDSLVIDTWLMSCRVLNRLVEVAILNELVSRAKFLNIKKIIGTYIPTGRNGLVANHYDKLGFVCIEVENKKENASTYELSISDFVANKVPIKWINHE
jgi:FkbH-like protein